MNQIKCLIEKIWLKKKIFEYELEYSKTGSRTAK